MLNNVIGVRGTCIAYGKMQRELTMYMCVLGTANLPESFLDPAHRPVLEHIGSEGELWEERHRGNSTFDFDSSYSRRESVTRSL